MNVLAALVLAYLLGSVLPADLIARSRGIDIRAEGTRNPGTTNAWDVLGVGAGLATGLFDITKGLIAMGVAAGLGLTLPMTYVAGIVCVLGHRYPIWSRFRGGQGTATSTGLLLYCVAASLWRGWVTLPEFAGIVVVAVVVFALFRTGTVVGVFVLPLMVGVIVLGTPDLALGAFTVLTGGFVWVVQVSLARQDHLLALDERIRKRLRWRWVR